MELPDVSAGVVNALEWKTYSVSRVDKGPLLAFVVDGLCSQGCRVLFASDPGWAPFYIVIESPGGERHGLLVYAFLANSKATRNRPDDEHRFQIKYGGNLKGVLDVAVDPHKLITTIFLGIDLERGIFVAADPLMNTPAPMSRSIEFKKSSVEQILDEGWAVWERARRPPRAKDRPAYDLADLRTEVLVGGRQERLLDLVLLERIARGLDPGERHLVADKLRDAKATMSSVKHAPHELIDELEVAPEALFDLINSASRLKMAVRGWVAEAHLEQQLRDLPGVSDCHRLEADGQPDISLRWRGSEPILIECKNTLRQTYADGSAKVDFQRTRASKGDPCSRYYSRDEFSVLAACLHAVKDAWIFSFALTADLPAHRSCEGRIANMIPVTEPTFTDLPAAILDRHMQSAA